MKKIIIAHLIIAGLIFIASCKNSRETNRDNENNTTTNNTRAKSEPPEPREEIHAVRSGDTVLVFYDTFYVCFYRCRAVRYEHFLPGHHYASQYDGRLVFPKISWHGEGLSTEDWDGPFGLSYYIGHDKHVNLIKHESGEFSCDQARFNKICAEAEERWQRWNDRFNTLGVKQAIKRESAQPLKVYFGNYYFDPPNID